MGKERLEWLKSTIERMGDSWYIIENYELKCPVCGGNLCIEYMRGHTIMDGNTVIHCDADEHTFFRRAMGKKHVLYLSKDATKTTSKYEKAFEYVDGNWKCIEK